MCASSYHRVQLLQQGPLESTALILPCIGLSAHLIVELWIGMPASATVLPSLHRPWFIALAHDLQVTHSLPGIEPCGLVRL